MAVHYATSPESSALQWLPKECTAGKKLPYLFSQCQAIHARALVPCADTPSAKFTYDAAAAEQAESAVLAAPWPRARPGRPATPGVESGLLHALRRSASVARGFTCCVRT